MVIMTNWYQKCTGSGGTISNQVVALLVVHIESLEYI